MWAGMVILCYLLIKQHDVTHTHMLCLGGVMCQQPASLKPLQVELAPAAASSSGLLLSLTFREGRLCKLQLLQTPLPEGVFSSSRPVDL